MGTTSQTYYSYEGDSVMINEEPYTVQEASDVLGVTRSAVYKML